MAMEYGVGPAPTLAQIDALARIWLRDKARVASNIEYAALAGIEPDAALCAPYWQSFADCLNAAIMCGDGSIMIQSGRIWLGIERDGYAHS